MAAKLALCNMAAKVIYCLLSNVALKYVKVLFSLTEMLLPKKVLVKVLFKS